jgi:fatty-acid desaturase
VYPLLAWLSAYMIWTHETNTLIYWLAAPTAGWLMLSCALVYHDVCGHRGAFGKWGSWIVGIWVTSGCPMLMKEMNTTWMARHRIHHKNTFEEKDPELFRNSMESSLMVTYVHMYISVRDKD